jgi:enoyl-CoA hydratase/carnithine racemase
VTSTVAARTKSGITTVMLNRPDKLNAFTASAYEKLAVLLRNANADPEVRVVVLRGTGRAFSSGVDLDAASKDVERERLGSTFRYLIETLITLEKPLVAAVHGVAVGFGATILLHCDFVLLANDARLRYPFTLLGTAPEAGSSFLLPLTVGPQRAAELILTGRWVTADEAVSYGLAARVVPAAELGREVASMAEALAAAAPEALTSAKRLLRTGQADAVRVALQREFDEAAIIGDSLGPIRRPPSR